MARLIGVELGPLTVRAVVFAQRLRTLEWQDLREVNIPGGDRPFEDRQRDAVAELVEGIGGDDAEFMVAMESRRLMVRTFTFPFFDRKRLARVVRVELDGDLPFPIDDCLVELVPAGVTGKGHRAIAYLARRADVEQQLVVLKSLGIDPKRLVPNSFALRQIGRYCDPNWGSSIAILLVSNRGIDVAMLSHGEDSSEPLQLADAASYTWINAHQGDVQERMISQLKRQFVDFEGEADRTCDALVTLGDPPAGFLDAVGEQLQIPMRVPDFGEIPGRRKPLGTQQIRTHAAAIALALEGAAGRESDVTFRRGKLSYRKSRTDVKEILVQAAVVFGIIAFLGLIDFGVKRGQLQSRLLGFEKQLIALGRGVIPSGQNEIKDPKRVISLMKSRIHQIDEEFKLIGPAVGTTLRTLDLVNLLSETIPSSLTVDISEMEIDDEKLTLKGVTDTFESVDKLVSLISETKKFPRVSKGNTQKAAEKVRFTISIDRIEKDKS